MHTITSQKFEKFGLNMETLNSLAQMKHLWKRKKKKKKDGGRRECCNNVNQRRRLRSASRSLSSSVTVWALIFVHLASDSKSEPLGEAPGFDFSCVIKKIMIQTLAWVCLQSQKCHDGSGIRTLSPWRALMDWTIMLQETSIKDSK